MILRISSRNCARPAMPNNDRRWMGLALGLGARGLGQVWPNPAVGCVIVKNDRVLGRGWTQPGGRPHAETVALAQAGPAMGATAYVTLEPCAHHGKTPPCANALVKAGIARVVCPISDPDPRVAGKGFAILRDAGIAVETGLMAAEAGAANAGFLLSKRHNRPFITLKLAASLDGRIATGTGESRWITGPLARAYVHRLRASHDAVMIGSGTAKADNPVLDIRGLGPSPANPVRVVLDSQLALGADSRLVQTARDIPLWLCHDAATGPRQKLAALGVEMLAVKAAANGLDVYDVTRCLASRGITRVLVEGGGQLAASLVQAGLVDRLEVFHAGLLLGAGGTPALGALRFDALADFPRVTLKHTRTLGNDTLSVWH